jgi:hypothetical protein
LQGGSVRFYANGDALASKASRNYFLLRKTVQSEITAMITIAKAKSPSYVTIGITPYME